MILLGLRDFLLFEIETDPKPIGSSLIISMRF